MAPPRCFLSLLFITLLISHSFSPGHGRDTPKRGLSDTESGLWSAREMREMMEVVMDYKEPGANTNPRGGVPPSPPKP